MRTAVLVILAVSIGIGIGTMKPVSLLALKNNREPFKYFVVRRTLPDVPTSEDSGALRQRGSSVITLLDTDLDVNVYRITAGARTLLHQTSLDHACFPSVYFTAMHKSTGGITVVMNSESILRTSKSSDDIQAKQWFVELGQLASIHCYCNSGVTTNPMWRPDIETPAICYQFSKQQPNWKPLAEQGNILFSVMSEEGMLKASKEDPDVEFLLVTVKVRK